MANLTNVKPAATTIDSEPAATLTDITPVASLAHITPAENLTDAEDAHPHPRPNRPGRAGDRRPACPCGPEERNLPLRHLPDRSSR